MIVQSARRYGVDPQAALAVAAVEGGHRWGAVGDQGSSYGPFQLHVGGALPAGKDAVFANSQAGIDYALSRIGSVAKGLRGKAAVAAIVRGFERPADPTTEIQRALANYGGLPPGGAQPAATATPSSAPPGLSPWLTDLLNTNRQAVGLPGIQFGPLGVQAGPRKTPDTAPGGSSARTPAIRGKTVRYLEHFAAPYGVTITSTTTGGHVKGSYHYKGRAVDFGGDSARLASLAAAALEHPQDFAEMFYTGPGNPGRFIKDGKVYANAKLDQSVAAHHHDHVHLAR